MGKLMFAMTAFWGYIAVSQLLLIWIAGAYPEETPFYIIRSEGGWGIVSMILGLGQFVSPSSCCFPKTGNVSCRELCPSPFGSW